VDLKTAEKQLNIKKAEVNIEELKFKILKNEAEKQRILDHIELQKELIEKLSVELDKGE